jgi:radical SAM superfamily enzyme YgiQ (UPF0313 family)
VATVLLINLPRQDAERAPAVIAGLAGICKSATVDYDVVDLNLSTIKNLTADQWRELQNYLSYSTNTCSDNIVQSFKSLIRKNLPRNNYKILAVSLFTYETVRASKLVLPILRELYPDSKIIIGGHGTDFFDPDVNKIFYKHALDSNLINAYILGEGEESLVQYLKDPDGWVNSDTKWKVSDLNTIPFACYDKIPPETYLQSGVIGTYITGSRGCVRNCSFCDVNHIWGNFRFRKADHIFEEILEHHLKHRVTLIEFTDNLINGSLSEFKKLNELLVSAQQKYPSLKSLRYRGDFICRPKDQFDENDWRLMSQAGGTDIVVGIESFSKSIRYDMGKKFDNTDIDFHLYASGKYGVTNTFLMQVGYPTETIDDHRINIEYLHKYQKYALAKVIKMIRWGYTTSILPGSPLDTKYRNLLPLVEEDSDSAYGSHSWLNLSNPSLTLEERLRRRLELHYISKKLLYNQPRVHDEFLRMVYILKKSKLKSSFLLNNV